MRVVFDTNVLIDGFQDDFSAQARLIQAGCDGALVALITPAIEREYRKILRRLIQDQQYRDRIEDFLSKAQTVGEEQIDVIIDDMDDVKFLRAAAGGGADMVVTNDQHLLTLGELGTTRILRPAEAWRMFEEESGESSEWSDFMKGIFK